MSYQHNIFTRTLLSYLIIIISTNSERRGKSLLKSSKNVQDLDYEGKATLGWTINEMDQSITFELEGETDGYVGFGISPHGTMAGADIFIAGVFPDGTAYHSDRFVPPGASTSVPKVDNHANWRLLNAEEVMITSATKRGHTEVTKTYLKFSRFLDTCDEEEDLKIGKNPIKFIWALGENDEVDYHGLNERGTKTIDLYMEILPKPSVELNDTLVFELALNMSLPEEEDSYWCTFYEGPELDRKHHVVAFSANLGDANAQKFVSHLTVYNCSVDGEHSPEETFKNFTFGNFSGANCLADFKEEEIVPPIEFCTEVLYTWSMGNMELYLPDNVGYAIGEQSRYFMLKVHLSNPKQLPNVNFNAGIHMQYVETLRPIEAGLLWVGHDTNLGLVVPPNVYDFVVAGHCSPSCSRRFPSNGVTVFNTMLNAHLSGRKLKLRHFRRGKELPWIDYDDQYDYDYQKNKQLVKPVQVLPGDQITLECTLDTTWKNGSVGIGGLSSFDEMCEGYIWYYPEMEITKCGSTIPVEESYLDFGITKYRSSTTQGRELIEIEEPESLQGEFETSLSTNFNWSSVFRQMFEVKRRFGLHDSICYTYDQRMSNHTMQNSKISYPLFADPYNSQAQPPLCTEERKRSIPCGVQNTKLVLVKTAILTNLSLLVYAYLVFMG